MTTKTQWSTTTPFLKNVPLPPIEQGLPTWVDEYDAQRLAAYALYIDIYNNNPNQYVLLLRGTEERPVYVPTARIIVDTMNRYVGRDFGFTITDADPTSSAPEAQIVDAVMRVEAFFKRERIRSKFSTAKRSGLTRGDWCFYIYANSLKPEGSRISLRPISPSKVFPIWDLEDDQHVVGYDVAELKTANNKTYVNRQRWISGSHPDHPAYQTANESLASIIYSSMALEQKDWQVADKLSVLAVSQPPVEVTGITNLPIYHIKNNDNNEDPFGRSELSGIEHVIAAVNQAVTDEDIALAMSGLGLFMTTSGHPVDENGSPTNWVLGPRRVVEIQDGTDFSRVSGVPSVQPSLEHVKYMEDNLKSVFGISDVVTGQMDVQVAESGIALALRMGPIVDASSERDLTIVDVMTQMLYDLRQWFLVYEGINMDALSIEPTFGEKMPRNRDAEFQEMITLLQEGLVTPEFVLERLQSKFGYEFDPQMVQEIITQQQQAASGIVDDRLNQEANPGDAGVSDAGGDTGGTGGE
jgi:hypothetical protein